MRALPLCVWGVGDGVGWQEGAGGGGRASVGGEVRNGTPTEVDP